MYGSDYNVCDVLQMDKSCLELIECAIDRHIECFPEEPIDIGEISLCTCMDITDVKEVLYGMLFLGKIKATFYPLHKWCGERLACDQECTQEIEEKIKDNGYPEKCPECGGDTRGVLGIAIAMTFWKLGKKIGKANN